MGLEFLYHLPLLAALVTFCGLREEGQKQGEEEKRGGTNGSQSEHSEGITRGKRKIHGESATKRSQS